MCHSFGTSSHAALRRLVYCCFVSCGCLESFKLPWVRICRRHGIFPEGTDWVLLPSNTMSYTSEKINCIWIIIINNSNNGYHLLITYYALGTVLVPTLTHLMTSSVLEQAANQTKSQIGNLLVLTHFSVSLFLSFILGKIRKSWYLIS